MGVLSVSVRYSEGPLFRTSIVQIRVTLQRLGLRLRLGLKLVLRLGLGLGLWSALGLGLELVGIVNFRNSEPSE